MTDSIISELLELMPDTLVATPGSLNAFGAFTASGEVLSLPCLIEGETQLVRDQSGREVTSSIQAFIGGAYDLTVDGHRYTLPARFSPREDLRAISIDRASDESGAHHETVMLP